ncbi:MAG: polysaccharide biosynthesis protein [Clostridium sp.]|nr:polysaccharide biosynthesis protein [Clostridium sp.]
MKKQSLIKGSLILSIAGIFTRALGLFFRWPLIMLIGDEGIGYYQMSYPLYVFFIGIASGVPIAISKIISENNALEDVNSNFIVIKEAFIAMMILSIGTSLSLFFGAKYIIKIFNWDFKAYYSLIGISIAPIVVSALTIFRGFFQGYQNMTPSAISQIIEQVGRVIFGVGLAIAFLPYGIEFSAGGASFGAVVGGIIAVVYLFIKYIRIKRENNIGEIKTDAHILNKILNIAIPISLGTSVSTAMSLIDSFLVPQGLLKAGFTSKEATILYAQLTGKASVIVNIPLTISMAICISVIPIIAEVFLLKRYEELQRKVNLIIKLAMIIAIPCYLGLFFMAEPIMKTIFPGKYEGYLILKYLSISIPFIIITQITTSILQGIGRYIIPVINLLIGCMFKAILTIILVPNIKFNIYGAVASSIIAYIIVSVINVIIVRKILNIRFELKKIFKILYCSIIMMIIVIKTYNFIITRNYSNTLACLISIGIGAIIYFIGIMLLGILKIKEIRG